MSKAGEIKFADSFNLDSFDHLRVSNSTGLFDSQLTYDLQPLLFEPITAESGASIAHDTTNRNALMTFSSTPTGGQAIMQSFEHFRYQPAKSLKMNISFNFIEAAADTLKFVGYSDGVNGIEFQNNGTDNQFVILSSSANGNQTVTQENWNLDKLDNSLGLNPSKIQLDITKSQIVIIDLQALYTGRVRVGFNIGGSIVYVHEFNHSNIAIHPYIQTANLPIRCGMTCTGTVSTTMKYTCCSVISEGGTDKTIGYEFSAEGTVTAASEALTHILSVRPKTTFNSIVNRSKIAFVDIDILNVGASDIQWQLVLGQAISGTITFNDVNATYSASEFNTAGTISGSAAIIIDSGSVAATGSGNNASGSTQKNLTLRYPITLDAAGAVRALGTLSLLVKGVGGTSAVRATMKVVEIR